MQEPESRQAVATEIFDTAMPAAKRQRLAADADLLIVLCSPAQAPLLSAQAEADAIQRSVQPFGLCVKLCESCTAARLRELIAELHPRVLVFIGHADATHPLTRSLTLGLTDAAGRLVTLSIPQRLSRF